MWLFGAPPTSLRSCAYTSRDLGSASISACSGRRKPASRPRRWTRESEKCAALWLQPSLPSAPHLAQTAPAAAADAKIAAWLPWLAANETTAVPSSSILKSIHSPPTQGSRRSRASSPAALSSSSLSSTTRRFRATLRCCWPRFVVPLLPLPLLRGIRPSTQSSSVPSSPVQSSTGGKKNPDIPWISQHFLYPGISLFPVVVSCCCFLLSLLRNGA